MNDPHSWYPFSAFKFFLIIFRIHFTKELSAIIMIKNELGGRPVRLKVNWCQKSAKALCRKHYGVHLFCQRDTRRSKRHIACSDFFKSGLSHFASPPFQTATAPLGRALVRLRSSPSPCPWAAAFAAYRSTIPFRIGVAKSRFVKPCVKISKVGSHPLVDDCPLNRKLYHHRRQSIIYSSSFSPTISNPVF